MTIFTIIIDHKRISSGVIQLMPGLFLGLIWGQILAPSQLEMSKNFPKWCYIIPNFFALHFGESFMKICTQIAKLQMHENLY